jgi:DNA-binding NarL/FixJ family response regulator
MEQAAKGLHAKEIASALGISPRTVEVHKTRLMAKLGVRKWRSSFASRSQLLKPV